MIDKFKTVLPVSFILLMVMLNAKPGSFAFWFALVALILILVSLIRHKPSLDVTEDDIENEDEDRDEDEPRKKKFRGEIESINNISPLGFNLNWSTGKIQQVRWDEMEETYWLEGEEVELWMKDGSEIIVGSYVTGRDQMLLAIPREKAGTAYERILTELDKNYEPYLGCKGCGYKGIANEIGDSAEEDEQEECEVCGLLPWNAKMQETETDYIRKHQLDYFSTDDATEPVDFDSYADEEYKKVPGWAPLVTPDEVIEYSRNNYWENEGRPVINAEKCLPCMVCGYFAIPHFEDAAAGQDKTCRVCCSEEWNILMGNEMDHLRQCQLEHFAVLDPGDKVEFYPKDEEDYRPIPHWKPRVTEQEVLEYSKKEYWD